MSDPYDVQYVSTWGVHCGIASYTHFLAEKVHSQTGNTILISAKKSDGSVLDPPTEIPYDRVWSNTDYNFDIKAPIIHFQHEFGLFPDSRLFLSRLCDLHQLGIKTVTTFHTVLPDQRQFYDDCSKFTQPVVHQDLARSLISNAITLPHGAYEPTHHLTDPEAVKKGLGLQGKRVVLLHGFFHPDKHYEFGVQAVKYVNSLLPDVICLIVAGRHPLADKHGVEILKAYGKEIMSMSPKSSKFIFRRVSDQELDAFIQISDVILYPYHPQTALSVSGNIMRTLAFGKPIVTSKSVRLSQVWNSLYETDQNIKDYASAIYNLLTDKGLYQKYAQKSLELAKKYAWSKVVHEEYKPFYDSL